MGEYLKMKILPEDQKIDVKSALDLFGKDFRFDHAKGIAEWLKNSADAYNQYEISDEHQNIIILMDVKDNSFIKEIAVLDFVGMSKRKIDDGFKVWFSPDASKVSNMNIFSKLKTYGGHGNGGKFYMRQMFKESRAISYYGGKINIFGFNVGKDYGYVPEFTDKKISAPEAIEIAGLRKFDLEDEWIENIISGKNGFTIMQGYNPKKSIGTNYKHQLAEKIVKNPQARRLIDRKNVFLHIVNGDRRIKLSAPSIKPFRGFDGKYEFIAPDNYLLGESKISLVSKKYNEPPKLTLFTSHEALKGTNFGTLNSIDFLGEIGVIANYRIHELSNSISTFAEFVYGECDALIMEDEDNDLVRNDRDKFAQSDRTLALLAWAGESVNELAERIEGKQRAEKRKRDLTKSSVYNQILDTWKNNFLNKLLRDQMFGDDQSKPGSGGEEDLGALIGLAKGKRSKSTPKKKSGTSGGDSKKKKPSHPTVLLSDHHEDPFSNEGLSLSLSPRHHAVHQRPEDARQGIYWINTSKPLAQNILAKFSSESTRWRSYMFQRYIDIIIKESIYQMGKRQLELSAQSINDHIDIIISDIHDKAADDLREFLFENDYEA